jgi:type III secretion protein L
MLSVAQALRGVRVLTPAAVAELPRLAGDAAAARHRIARAEAEHLALLGSVRDAAQQLGYQAGHAQAVEELARFNAGLRELASDHASALHVLLLRALRRLLGELPPDLVLAQLAEQALLAARDDATKVQVFVHPQHGAAVSERLHARDGLAIEVRADASLGPTDCRVDTGVGSIDASLPTQLAALEAALTARCQLSQPSAWPPLPQRGRGLG